MRIKLLGFIVASILTNGLYPQGLTLDGGSDAFSQVKFDLLQVYTLGRVPGDFPSTSWYPFKGQRLHPALSAAISQALDEDPSLYDAYYATHKFDLTARYEGCLLRAFYEGGSEHHIYLLVYDRDAQRIHQTAEIAYSYGYEGGQGAMESWLTDLNGDGVVDILSRSWAESQIPEGDSLRATHQDRVRLGIWDGEQFVLMGVVDAQLQAQIENQFSYHGEEFVDLRVREGVAAYLKHQGHPSLIPTATYPSVWAIIQPSGTDLAIARRDLDRVRKALESRAAFDPDFQMIELVQQGDTLYIAVGQFYQKDPAEVALRRMADLLHPAARLVDLSQWCPDRRYQEGGFVRCED